MTVFFVHPSVLPDILELMPDAEAHEYKMVDGEIGMVDGGVHIVPMERIAPFAGPPLRAPLAKPRGRGAQWKSERVLAGRRWGK